MDCPVCLGLVGQLAAATNQLHQDTCQLASLAGKLDPRFETILANVNARQSECRTIRHELEQHRYWAHVAVPPKTTTHGFLGGREIRGKAPSWKAWPARSNRNLNCVFEQLFPPYLSSAPGALQPRLGR